MEVIGLMDFSFLLNFVDYIHTSNSYTSNLLDVNQRNYIFIFSKFVYNIYKISLKMSENSLRSIVKTLAITRN